VVPANRGERKDSRDEHANEVYYQYSIQGRLASTSYRWWRQGGTQARVAEGVCVELNEDEKKETRRMKRSTFAAGW